MRGRLLLAAAALALAGPAAAQVQVSAPEAANILINRLTGTELILVDGETGQEIARGALLSTSIDSSCEMTFIWTGDAATDTTIHLGRIGRLEGDGDETISATGNTPDRPTHRFVVGPPRYADTLQAFETMANACD